MGSVYEEITRLETAKTDIETAIEGCGVNVPDADLISTYAQYIRQIPSAVFSEFNVDPVGGEDQYIQAIKQKDGLIEATTGGLVSSTSSGLVPKITTATVLINNQSADWVLTSKNGAEPQWKKLPVASFAKYIGTTEVQTVSQAQELKGITNIYNTDNKEILHSGDYFELNKGYNTVPFWFNGSQYKFNLGSKGVQFMISETGNVGIGNVGGAPKAKLHIAGGSVLANYYHAWSGGFSKEGCSDAQLLLAGGGHMNLTGLFTDLTSNSTNAISITIGTTTKNISKTTLASSLGLGTNAYSSTAYLPLSGGTMTGDISWNTDSHGIYLYNGCGIEKWEGYAPALVAEGNNTNFYIRNGQNRGENYRILHTGNYKRYVDPQIFPGLNATGTVTSITIIQGTGITVSDSGVAITSSGSRTISLNAASSSAIGGVKLGYTASGANIPLQTSSNKGYVALTKAAVVAALGYTPPESDTNTTYSQGTGISISGTTISNAGVRSTTINGNFLRVNTNGTNVDLTIPYASSAGYADSAGNADTVDSLHASDFVKFYLSPMTSDAPADSAKSWFRDTMPSSSGAIIYNVPGSEKTIIAGKSSGAYGHMLQLSYDDNYLRMLRYFTGTWKTNDWEKISAGYADSAGSVAWSNVTGKPTIPTVGNGTVTIKQGGTEKGSFTMNQSGNTTIELSDTGTNTDTQVTQTSSTTNADYRVLLSGSANDTSETTTAYKSTKLKFNPSSGTMSVGGIYSGSGLYLTGVNGIIVQNVIKSTVTSGKPMEVSSTTKVDNLNADMIDGYHIVVTDRVPSVPKNKTIYFVY